MSREWQIGDVATLTNPDGSEYRVMRSDGFWECSHSTWRDGRATFTVRPLVVIDPEDVPGGMGDLTGTLLTAAAEYVDRHKDNRGRNVKEVQLLRHLAELFDATYLPLKPEVYEHMVYADKGGVASALCGKVWEPNRADVTILGKCPECEQLVIGGWVA